MLIFIFGLSFNINHLPISELLYEVINLGLVDPMVLLPSFPWMVRILNECEPDIQIIEKQDSQCERRLERLYPKFPQVYPESVWQ